MKTIGVFDMHGHLMQVRRGKRFKKHKNLYIRYRAEAARTLDYLLAGFLVCIPDATGSLYRKK